LQLTLPAIITTDLRLNEPRFATLPNIMKAKSKSIICYSAKELGVLLSRNLERIHVEPPEVRDPGVKLNSINELMEVLKEKEEVLP